MKLNIHKVLKQLRLNNLFDELMFRPFGFDFVIKYKLGDKNKK